VLRKPLETGTACPTYGTTRPDATAKRSAAMQMIYNSPNYCVVEFAPQAGHHLMNAGGYEIVDKNAQREIFIDGELAERFRAHVKQLIEDEPSLDEVDEFLGQFDSLMMMPVVLH
jgi:hypothetical protein